MSTPKTALIAYGHSGEGTRPSAVPFPGGNDRNRSFELAARTLASRIRSPSLEPIVRQTWSQHSLGSFIREQANGSVQEIHVFCHGSEVGLSLAYYYDNRRRLRERAARFAKSPASDLGATKAALLEEDAVLSGWATFALDPDPRRALQDKFAEDPLIQIWACHCGAASARFYGDSDPLLNPYFLRFNRGMALIDGIARDLAKGLGVSCTASRNDSGLSFWHRGPGGRPVPNGTATRPREPFWLWPAKGADWVTYAPNGDADKIHVRMAGGQKFAIGSNEIATGVPPGWLR